jgi:hypothetical protein
MEEQNLIDTFVENLTTHLANIPNVHLLKQGEDYYETIRLGYVALFHKYESFIKDMIIQINIFLSKNSDNKEPIDDYSNRKFNFKIDDWNQNDFLKKIYYICNCVKHWDSYPKRGRKPENLFYLPLTEKMKFTKETFKSDMEIMEVIFQIMLKVVLSIAIFQAFFDKKTEYEPNTRVQDEMRKIIEGLIQTIQ